MQNRCAVPNCSSSKSDLSHSSGFRVIQKNNRCEHEAQCKVLKDDAMQTIFDVPNQPQNGQVKRSKETTKDDETESRGRKKMKSSQADSTKADEQTDDPEEDEYRHYLMSLFEVLVLLGEQNIPPTGPGDRKQDGLEQRKSAEPEEESVQVFKNYIPNAEHSLRSYTVVLRLIGILPTLALEDSCNVAYKRFK
ncbi:hypothetical protein INR49_016072, partial [Caranx melampygus]